MEPSATSTTVAGPVGEHLQVGTEDALVLDRLAPFRRLHDSGAGYKYPDLLTYLREKVVMNVGDHITVWSLVSCRCRFLLLIVVVVKTECSNPCCS